MASPPNGSSPFSAEGPPQPRLEDEIDFLARELARQEAGPSRLTAPPQLGARQRLLEPGEDPAPLPCPSPPPWTQPGPAFLTCLLSAAATLGLSERGQGPDLGLPSTRGAPAPTPHTSLGTPVSSGPVHMAPLEPRGERGDGLALGRSRRAGGEAGSRGKAVLTAPLLAVLVVVCSVAGAAAFAVAALCWCR